MLSFSMYSARRIVTVRRSLLGALALFAVAAVPTKDVSPIAAQTAVAQATPIAPPERRISNRQDLEMAAANFEQRSKVEKDATKRAELLRLAGIIRGRLAYGDFQPGHRILLFVGGDSALVDTFTVRADQKLQLPDLPDISLSGVLDSELQGYLKTQLAKYIRNPDVRAQALLRVSVSGDVTSPGFYSIRTDTPVSDVIMTAGGPSGSADMGKVVLRRGTAVVVKKEGIQEAIRSELTMTDIGARPGDELYVPTKPTGSNWTKLAAATASITGIVWTVVWIAGRR
jgi:protein involved in polysaccharide export with SLBB domain